jgi:GntR family transcriptional regulator
MTTGPFRTPDRQNPLPLWAQVLADVRARLARGDFAGGFPPERELIDQYGVSRHTMRDAMRRLHAEGLIDRERGRGTFVRPQGIEQPTGALYSLFRSVEDQGFVQHSRVLALDVRTAPEVAVRVGLDAATRFVYLHRVRNADDTPIATDELWMPADLATPLLSVDFEHTAVYAELERRCGIRPGAGWERVHPTMPTSEERALLTIAAGEPAFLVERFTSYDSRPLEWRRTVIRGDRYTFLSAWNDTGEQRDRSSFIPNAGAAAPTGD